ncbi:MAG TPA: hypothetical protein V6C52_02660 [Coleofasciculaceae cyanobacterium]|jgi:hypothetical protein
MLAFHLFHYKLVFDPDYAIEFLNHLWVTEPVGTTSICVTLAGILLTLSFKLFDFGWELYKERARQGKLKIELSAGHASQGAAALSVVISNTGREPIVIREIGYAQSRLFGTEFVPVTLLDSPLPHALNARDLVQLRVDASEMDLSQLAAHFRVKDSLGKIWEAPDSETRKARRQVRALTEQRTSKQRANQSQAHQSSPALEEPSIV